MPKAHFVCGKLRNRTVCLAARRAFQADPFAIGDSFPVAENRGIEPHTLAGATRLAGGPNRQIRLLSNICGRSRCRSQYPEVPAVFETGLQAAAVHLPFAEKLGLEPRHLEGLRISSAPSLVHAALISPYILQFQRDSNPHPTVRSGLSYPLDDGTK